MSEPARPVALVRRAVDQYLKLSLVLRTALLVAWGGFLWYQSSLAPRPRLAPSPLRSWLYNAAHVPAFGLFGLLAALLAPPRWRIPVGVVASLVYGIVDEIHQATTPGRTSSWTDVLSDTVGAGLVMAAYAWLVLGSRRAFVAVCVLLPCAVLAPTLATLW